MAYNIFSGPTGPCSGNDQHGYGQLIKLMGERSTDSCLLLAARGGDQQAFEILVGRYNRALLRYAARMVGEDRAQDLMQTVWIKVWQWSADSDKQLPEQIKPWLYSITRNSCLNMIRDAKPEDCLDEVAHASCENAVHHSAETKQRTLELLTQISKLPSRQHQALMMHASGGYSHEQIAEHMQESPQAVRGLIFRARTSMRERSLAWVGGFLPMPLVSRWVHKWQHADQLGTAVVAGGAAGGGGAAVVGSGKITALVAAGTVALGGGAAVIHKADRLPAPRIAMKANIPAASVTQDTTDGQHSRTALASHPPHYSPSPISNSVEPKLARKPVDDKPENETQQPVENQPAGPDVLTPSSAPPEDPASQDVFVPAGAPSEDEVDSPSEPSDAAPAGDNQDTEAPAEQDPASTDVPEQQENAPQQPEQP